MTRHLLLIALFAHQLLSAQIPGNFELLDHNQRWSNLGANLLMSDSLIYISHNGQWPMTSIKIAHKNNSIKTIFESPFSGESKIVQNQNGSTDLFIYNIYDYDVGIPGFYVLHINNGRYSLDKYIDETFEDINYDLYAYDIIRGSDSTFWMMRDSDIAILSNGEVTPVHELEQAYNYTFYKNPDGDIFIHKGEKLFSVGTDSLVEKAVFPQNIIDISNHQDKNLVLLDKKLQVYDSDFTNLVHSWELPFSAPNLQYLQLIDDKLYCLRTEDENFDIILLDRQGNSALLLSDSSEFEFIKGFNFLSDTSMLLKGQLTESNIYSNIFLRNISTNSAANYSRLKLELSEFKLHRTGKDSTFNYVIVDGDSIFTYNFSFDFDVSFKNNSDSVISFTNIFSLPYYTFLGPPDAYFRIDYNYIIAPGERINKTGSFVVPFTSNTLVDLKIIAPGANNRFNSSPFASIIADFTSSVQLPEVSRDKIEIFPNPSSDFITIKSDLPLSKYLIYDSGGKLVQSASNISDRINVSRLESGLYYLKTLSPDGSKSRIGRFVKR